jgi:CheY-like chemotaxis protein
MNKGITKVFYVDDNTQSRRLFSSMLAQCGFEMIEAGNPIEALCRCRDILFSLPDDIPGYSLFPSCFLAFP